MGEVVRRPPADPGAGAVGAERDHGRWQVPVPSRRGRAAAALVRAQEQAWRARLRDGLQRGVLDDPSTARLAAADLHHLQRRLPAILLARFPRLFRLPAHAPGRAAAIPTSDPGQVARTWGVHRLDGELLLRRLVLAQD